MENESIIISAEEKNETRRAPVHKKKKTIGKHQKRKIAHRKKMKNIMFVHTF